MEVLVLQGFASVQGLTDFDGRSERKRKRSYSKRLGAELTRHLPRKASSRPGAEKRVYKDLLKWVQLSSARDYRELKTNLLPSVSSNIAEDPQDSVFGS